MTVPYPATNAEVLAGIFGPIGAHRPRVTHFEGDPKQGGKARWNGTAWAPGVPSEGAHLNWYTTLATFKTAKGRKADNVSACHGFMLDDIGTKAKPLPLPPSMTVETSPGNYQGTYLFPTALTEDQAIQRLRRLMDALIAAGYGDSGAKDAPTRYGRLPFASNGKHSPPFPCRLVEWRPELRYTVDQIANAIGVDLDAAPPEREQLPARLLHQMDEAEQQRLQKRLRRALQHVSAEDREQWVAVGQNLKSLGDLGYDLWLDWSKSSPEAFNPEDTGGRWDGFGGDGSDYRAVFTKAIAAGWDASPHPEDVGFGTCPLPVGASLTPIMRITPPPALVLPMPPFREVPIADLATAPPEPMVWWWGAYLPAGEVTLLAGHGGAGKSFLALTLAVCLAAGHTFLGQTTRPGTVVYFSGEDSHRTVRRRLTSICSALKIDPASLAQRLRVLDATDGSPVLFSAPRHGSGAASETLAALAEFIKVSAADVVIVDNASDAFDGDEINRAQVRAFVRMLALLVRPRGGAVLLLAHVDKQTSRAGRGANSESYSGSTAWHNSVRSRLFYREASPGVLELLHEKSTHGLKCPPLTLTWPEGRIPMLMTEPVPGAVNGSQEDGELRALLQLLASEGDRGKSISPAPNSPNNVNALLRECPGFPVHLKARQVHARLGEAERRMLLETEEYKKPDRHPAKRWKVTEAGRHFLAAGSAAGAGSSSLTAVIAHAARPAGSAACAAGGCGGDTAHAALVFGGILPAAPVSL